MQNQLLCLLSLLCCIHGSALQAQQLQIVDGKACVSYERPLLLTRGDTVIAGCDSLFVINSMRYRMYEAAKNSVLGFNYQTVDNIFAEYEKRIKLCEETNNRITQNIGESVTKSVGNLESNVNALNEVQLQLNTSRQAMNKAADELKIAYKNVRREKWKWGVGGVVVGALAGTVVGVLISK